MLVTRSPGYVIELGDGELDLHVFERLVEEGRRSLDDGDSAAAAAVLRRALTLWHGRPLADLEYERFAADAVARLDEAWLEALELRVDADLALGRHTELVGELQTLVRNHPLRERLLRQMLLALYRSGRQAEALDAYAAARRRLADDLGLEPGPELRRLEHAILNQDPVLDLEPAQTRPGRQRNLGLAAVAGVLAVALVVAVSVVLADGDNSEKDEPAAGGFGGELLAIGAENGRIQRRFPAGRTPAALAAGAGQLWLVDADARTVLRLETSSGETETLATGATPADVAIGAGAVWIANGSPLSAAQFVGPVATEIVRLDTRTRTQRATVALPRVQGAVSNSAEQRIAATGKAIWAVTASGAIVRIDPQTNAITAKNPDAGAIAVATGGAGVWILRSDGVATALHERTARPRKRVRLPTDAPTALAVGKTTAWATSSADGTLWRIGIDGSVGSVAVGRGVTDVAVAKSRVWVANPIAGSVTAVDPATMRIARTVRVGGTPRSLAVDGETLWVAVAGEAPATRATAQGVEALPESTCEPVIAGADGRADVLIASDLPLQGGIRITALQMTQAITFVLRERRFRAGRFRVAYQSCDDSVARTGLSDEAKCAGNARSYAENADVVVVIGTLNSPCAVAALPELNRARGGPLAMISPLNSFVGLTRQAPGVAPELEGLLYPTGRRNYLRVFPTDDLQGAALALLARDRGRNAVFVLDDGEPGYGVLMATGFTTAARRLGLEVAGRATWNPGASSYDALARRVADSGAGAVFVGGLLDTNSARVIRDLRARLPASVDLLGPDGLTPLPLLREKAGAAALGTFVSLGGLVPERLPRAGARFARRFARTQAGTPVEPSAVYAAQATEVVLAALARSEGTRASVLDALFRVRIRDGLLGDFGFDRRGDITESPVTIMRLTGGGSSTRILSVEGGVIERVSRPRASLVAEAR
ncbi:MAG: BTAD domain-containing putative transcriptional regulator [Gaiellaceae bacterium]